MFKAWFLSIGLLLWSSMYFLDYANEVDKYNAFQEKGVKGIAYPEYTGQEPERSREIGGEYRREYFLKFKTESGQPVFATHYLSQRNIDRIEKEGSLPITYLRDSPSSLLADGEVAPRDWGHLINGLFVLVLAVVSIRMRESIARFLRVIPLGDAG